MTSSLFSTFLLSVIPRACADLVDKCVNNCGRNEIVKASTFFNLVVTPTLQTIVVALLLFYRKRKNGGRVQRELAVLSFFPFDMNLI